MQEAQETWVWSLGQEDPLKKEMATYSSVLAWRILCTEELGGLQFIRLQRVRHSWTTEDTHTHRNWHRIESNYTPVKIFKKIGMGTIRFHFSPRLYSLEQFFFSEKVITQLRPQWLRAANHLIQGMALWICWKRSGKLSQLKEGVYIFCCFPLTCINASYVHFYEFYLNKFFNWFIIL